MSVMLFMRKPSRWHECDVIYERTLTLTWVWCYLWENPHSDMTDVIYERTLTVTWAWHYLWENPHSDMTDVIYERTLTVTLFMREPSQWHDCDVIYERTLTLTWVWHYLRKPSQWHDCDIIYERTLMLTWVWRYLWENSQWHECDVIYERTLKLTRVCHYLWENPHSDMSVMLIKIQEPKQVPFYFSDQWWFLPMKQYFVRNHPKSSMLDTKGNQLQRSGEGGQESISYFSISLSHTHVEMNKICLK